MKVYEKLNELLGINLSIEEYEKNEICPTEFAGKLGVKGCYQEKMCILAVHKCCGECDSVCIYRFLISEIE